MRTGTPHIGLLCEDQIPPALIEGFQDLVAAEGLDLEIEYRETSKGYAGVEWLLPTAVMLFVAKSYFDGFLGEMGKDHYQALKAGIRLLRDRLGLVKVTLIGTPGKVSTEQPYSLVYSIWFAPSQEKSFKFLVPNDPAESEIALNTFLDFLEGFAMGTLPIEEMDALMSARAFGRIVLLAYNPQSGKIEQIHPITRQFGEAIAHLDVLNSSEALG